MTKADYSGQLLDRVEVRSGPGARLGDREVWTRERVVDALLGGARMVTMREAPGGGWIRGEDVELLEAGEGLYVRVDGDGLEGDQLGELPGMAMTGGPAARR